MALIATNCSGAEHAGDHGHRGGIQRNVGPGCHGDVQLRCQFGCRLDVQHLHVAATDDQSGRTCRPGRRGRPGDRTQAGTKAQTTSTQLMSSVPQALQSLSTPGSSSTTGLSQAAMGTGASLGSSGASAPAQCAVESDRHVGQERHQQRERRSGRRVEPNFGPRQCSTAMRPGWPSTRSAWAPIWPAWAPMRAGLGPDGGRDLVSDSCRPGTRLRGRGFDYRGPRGPPEDWEPEWSGRPRALGGLDGGAVGGPGPSGLARHLVGAAELGRRACRRSRRCPLLDANVMPGGWGAAPTPSAATGTGVSKLPLGGMVGRESDGAVQRIGFRSSLIPRSPVAG